MSKLHSIYIICILLGWAKTKAQENSVLVSQTNQLSEYISTGEINLQWNSDKEVIIIATPRKPKSTPTKKAYSYCTKFGQGASYEDGFIVYKGKKNAIVVTGLQMGEYCYFTSYTANKYGVFNVPGPPLTSFVVWSLGLKAEINFKAATTSTNEHFIIERSMDGINWDHISFINASQDQKGIFAYNYVDKGPLNGYYLYRLKQNTNQTLTTSEPTAIETFSFSTVYELLNSDETANHWFVVSDIETELSITNAIGQLMKRITLNRTNEFTCVIDDLPLGIYNLNGFNSNGELNSKIMVNE